MDAIFSTILLLFHVLTGGAASAGHGQESASTQQLLAAVFTASAAQHSGAAKPAYPTNDSTSPEATPMLTQAELNLSNMIRSQTPLISKGFM